MPSLPVLGGDPVEAAAVEVIPGLFAPLRQSCAMWPSCPQVKHPLVVLLRDLSLGFLLASLLGSVTVRLHIVVC